MWCTGVGVHSAAYTACSMVMIYSTKLINHSNLCLQTFSILCPHGVGVCTGVGVCSGVGVCTGVGVH